MLLRFTKMHGLGNDFMVIDLVTQHVQLSPKQIRQWSDRYTGIGFDQLLVVEPPGCPDADFRYRIYNADGSEVEQCGNGARCFARFVQDKRLTAKSVINVETAGGPISLHVRRDGQVTVDMGAPRFTPADVPFIAEQEAEQYALEVAGEQLMVAAVSMGNPHCVTLVDDINNGMLERLGETQACGTGACAAAVAGIRLGLLRSPVQIQLPGGNLQIEWAGPGQPVLMTGPATRVYEGQIRV